MCIAINVCLFTFQGIYHDKLLVGDSGYAQTRYMMTPLPENAPTTRAEKLYQESQIRTRNVIERAFGIWKRRFPILSKGINVNLRRVPGETMVILTKPIRKELTNFQQHYNLFLTITLQELLLLLQFYIILQFYKKIQYHLRMKKYLIHLKYQQAPLLCQGI